MDIKTHLFFYPNLHFNYISRNYIYAIKIYTEVRKKKTFINVNRDGKIMEKKLCINIKCNK